MSFLKRWRLGVARTSSRSARRAFSLTELLVVIALIAVLVALTMPALKAAKDRSKTTQCLNNLRQIGQGMLLYAADRGSLPHSSHYDYWCDWAETILPYMVTGKFVWNPQPWPNGLWQETASGAWIDRPYSQNRYKYFTCPAGPAAPAGAGIKYPHNYGCNEWLMPLNYKDYYVGNRPVPGIKLANVERPGSVLLILDNGIFEPSLGWGGGDCPDTCWQFKVIIEQDFVNNPTTAALNGETLTTTPDANNNDSGTGDGWPVYTRHNGRCNALMADGHVQSFRNGEIKRKNWVSKGAKCKGWGGPNQYVEVGYP